MNRTVFFICMLALMAFNNNAFSQWEIIQNLPNDNVEIRDIFVADYNNIILVGSKGTIFRTYNAGKSWQDQSIHMNNTINSAWLIYQGTTKVYRGHAVGDNGLILSVNYGDSLWSIEAAPVRCHLRDIWFINKDVGFIVGENGTILKTPNRGRDWFLIQSGTTENLTSIFFVNGTIGYISGIGRNILKTTDSGESWNIINTHSNYGLTSVYFLNENVGYVSSTSWDILKTIDGGNNWDIIHSEDHDDPRYLHSIFFVDKNIGFAVGDWGTFLKTTDGGKNWSYSQLPNADNIGLYSLYFFNRNLGYVLGGKVFKTMYGGSTFIDNSKKNLPIKNFDLLQNYPNPFNPKTTIPYQIDESSTIKISIYSITGQLVKELLNEYKQPGYYSIEWDGTDQNNTLVTSGIYLCKLSKNNSFKTRQIVLLK